MKNTEFRKVEIHMRVRWESTIFEMSISARGRERKEAPRRPIYEKIEWVKK